MKLAISPWNSARDVVQKPQTWTQLRVAVNVSELDEEFFAEITYSRPTIKLSSREADAGIDLLLLIELALSFNPHRTQARLATSIICGIFR